MTAEFAELARLSQQVSAAIHHDGVRRESASTA
jgi:hypothetical protein